MLPAEHVPRGRAGRGGAPYQHQAGVLRGELHGGDQRGSQLRQPVLHRVRATHMRRAQRHLRRGHGGRLSSDQRARPDGRHGEEHRGRAADTGRRTGHGHAEDDRPTVAAGRAGRHMRHGAIEKLRLRGRRVVGTQPAGGRRAAEPPPGDHGGHGRRRRPFRALHDEPLEGAHTHVPPTVGGKREPGAQNRRAAGRDARRGNLQTVSKQQAPGTTRVPATCVRPPLQPPSGTQSRQTVVRYHFEIAQRYRSIIIVLNYLLY